MAVQSPLHRTTREAPDSALDSSPVKVIYRVLKVELFVLHSGSLKDLYLM